MTNWNRRDRRHTTFHRHYFHAIRWSGGPGPGPSDIGYEPPVRPRARCRSAREPGSLYPKPRTRDASHRDWFSPKLCPDLPMTADATPGGEPQRSLRSLALPLASAEKLLRRCPCSAQRSTQTARLGDSFYFAECEIGESLLRRGARISP